MYVSRTKSRALCDGVRRGHLKRLRVDNQVAHAIVVFAARQATDLTELKLLIHEILDDQYTRGVRKKLTVASLLKSGIDRHGNSVAPQLPDSDRVTDLYEIDEVVSSSFNERDEEIGDVAWTNTEEPYKTLPPKVKREFCKKEKKWVSVYFQW
ncbi:hypothetical protein PF006_g32149 [Phytophthora fragariae]|uniref:Uncharacterized protein n=1 Tax=Phytophthora fragariae TaxID=53985 RepID=A0A6A3PTM2_9STRA|nr:hypothetical protein PF006_g32149 [Phytophthora fragariae]